MITKKYQHFPKLSQSLKTFNYYLVNNVRENKQYFLIEMEFMLNN